MKTIFLILIGLLLARCTKEASSETAVEDIFKTFNNRAKKQVLKNFPSYDLYPLTDIEKCILREGISTQLDAINDSKLVVLDSFYIRNYEFQDLGCHFSIVASRNRIHFLFLPRIYEYWYTDKYYVLKDTIHELRNSDLAIGRINSGMLDAFLEDEVFVSQDTVVGQHLASLFEEIFPELTHYPVTATEFQEWVYSQPVHNRRAIETTLLNGSKRKRHLTPNGNFRIYKIEYLGYIFFDFYLDEDFLLNRKVEIYFIPYNQRYGMGFEIEQEKFKDCYNP